MVQHTGLGQHVEMIGDCTGFVDSGGRVFAEKNIHHNMSSFQESVALGYLKQECIQFVKYPSVLFHVSLLFIPPYTAMFDVHGSHRFL